MPYTVSKSKQCPPSKPHAVLRDDGTVVPGGCHATHADAVKHHRGLVTNVPDAKGATAEATANVILEQGEIDSLHASDHEMALRDL